jgi:hypothetical protein
MTVHVRPCPFHRGDTVVCTLPLKGVLAKGGLYHVSDTADIGPPTTMVSLREYPENLFHPKRFLKVSSG